MSKMSGQSPKICFITTVSITMKSFILDVAKFLHEHKNYDITFICSDDPTFKDSLPLYIHYYPTRMRRGINLDGIKAIIQMIQLFRKEQYDIIQYSTPNASCYASIAAWVSRRPIRLYCQWGIAYVGFSGIKRIIFKNIEKLVCLLSTHIEPDSFGNLEYSIQEGLYDGNKGSVVWNGSSKGVNLNIFDISRKKEWRSEIRSKYNINDKDIVIGFVGRINRDKGINELLYAFKKISEENPGVKLLVVGNIEDKTQIEPEIYKWSLSSKQVIYCGFQNHIEKYFSAMDIFVLPSYREGFPNAVLEAEAMGVPVVVTDIPGCRDAIINNVTGILVRARRYIELEEKLLMLIYDRNQRDLLGSKGYCLAKSKFNEDEMFVYIGKDKDNMLSIKYNN